MALLSLDELKLHLQALPGWEPHDNALSKTFEVKSFVHGVVLIGAIAQAAEAADHHPDLNLHSYSKLTVTLSTHSEGGLTIKDIQLAERIEGIPQRGQT
jgi:4a-hydroxytetrahydrobiopterin dehydratase